MKQFDKDFIKDMVWMSYRYCIGHDIIAARMHAGALAENITKDVLSENELKFNAQDIFKEITSNMQWNSDFYNEAVASQDVFKINSYNRYMECLMNMNVRTKEELSNYKNIHYDGKDYRVVPFILEECEKWHKPDRLPNELEEFKVWADLASYWYGDYIKAKSLETQKEFECFESFIVENTYNEKTHCNDSFVIRKVYIPVEWYKAKNSNSSYYFADEVEVIS